jgi:hypothetical protein
MQRSGDLDWMPKLVEFLQIKALVLRRNFDNSIPKLRCEPAHALSSP